MKFLCQLPYVLGTKKAIHMKSSFVHYDNLWAIYIITKAKPVADVFPYHVYYDVAWFCIEATWYHSSQSITKSWWCKVIPARRNIRIGSQLCVGTDVPVVGRPLSGVTGGGGQGARVPPPPRFLTGKFLLTYREKEAREKGWKLKRKELKL